MIKKLTKAKDFGIFRDFHWDANILDDFQKYNLIYGWNYSGKTTLSRVFRCFELGRLHDDYSGATFEAEDDTGAKYDQLDLNQPFPIRVFNSDFVRDNLKWETDIEPILILGEENIKLQDELEEVTKQLTEKKGLIKRLNDDKIDKEQRIEKAFTSKASEIKNTLLGIPNYDKTNLKPIVDRISAAGGLSLLSDEQKEGYLKSHNNIQKQPPIELIPSSFQSMSKLCEQTQLLVNRTAIATTIEKLKSNPELNEWIRKGKDLHENKSLCEFCGGKLPDDLLDKLNAHFSADYENLLGEIDQLIADLGKDKVDINFPDEARFYSEFQNQYEKSKLLMESERASFNASIDKLIANLHNKKTKPFEAFTIEKPLDNTSQLQSAIADINDIIRRHNKKTDKFESEKEEAKKKLIKHWASEFVRDEQYGEALVELENKSSKIDEQKKAIGTIQNRINDIQAKLSEPVKGADRINQYLKLYFGNEEIKITVTGDEKFKIIRSEVDAKNLSEGEKTAIAFAYFMTRLEDRDTALSNPIVFIDDPVSSLDCNHLYHTYSFIRNKLVGCEQVFISTHNFEFFNLVKDWFREKRNRRSSSFYLIEKLRHGEISECSLTKAPPLLLRFKSEYHYLFSLLYEFNEDPKPDYDKLYILPNLVRRYLEAFLGFKVPRAAGLKNKLQTLFEDEILRGKVLKFVHEYSHNKSLPRSLNFPDFGECKEIVRAVLEAVKRKDREHFDNLKIELVSA